MKKEDVTRWQDLDLDTRSEVARKTRILLGYMNTHRGEMVPWHLVNELVSHVYRFFIDDYNCVHQWTKVKFDDNGIWIEYTNDGNK